MKLAQALRIKPGECVVLVGAGGKTTAIFQLARELAPCVVTTTTHLGTWQVGMASQHLVWELKNNKIDLQSLETDVINGITLITGVQQSERFTGLDNKNISVLREFCKARNLPLLIEADGSKQKPLKAPAEHEPAIPDCGDKVVVVVGLSALGKQLGDEFVHRSERFAALLVTDDGADWAPDNRITPAMITRVLTQPDGGLKNIPAHARRVALLNQADDAGKQSMAGSMVNPLLKSFDSVVISGMEEKAPAEARLFPLTAFSSHSKTAGIILAAGRASRFGNAKQLLNYHGKPFVQIIAETALKSGLSPVIIMTGAYQSKIDAALEGMENIQVIFNPDWESGQSTSIKRGINTLPKITGAALFLLADQPQVTVEVIRALIERHAQTLDPVIAPYVFDQRANPVLFDQVTFEALSQLTGDVGGRGIFSKFSPRYLNWYDKHLLLDVDTPEDYERLLSEA